MNKSTTPQNLPPEPETPDEYEEIEDKLRRDSEDKPMPKHGQSVFQIKEILEKKPDSDKS